MMHKHIECTQGVVENSLLGGGIDEALAAAESVKAAGWAAHRSATCSRVVDNMLRSDD